MDARSIALRASLAQDRRRASQQQQKQQTYDSGDDASSTLESIKNLMAANLRGEFKHGASRDDDILFAAKHARAQMPAQFREPPSSTGSHGTLTHNEDSDGDGDGHSYNSSSTFSGGLDAESTRASLYGQRRGQQARHPRVHKATGRFNDKKNRTDVLSGVVNTSALFRNFKEWQPDDATTTDTHESDDVVIRPDDDVDVDNNNDNYDDDFATTNASTTNFCLIDRVASRHEQSNKENHGPGRVASKSSQGASAAALRRNGGVALQPMVQNETDLSLVMSTALKQHRQQQQEQQHRKASKTAKAKNAAPVVAAHKSVFQQQEHQQRGAQLREDQPPPVGDLTSPETSAGSREDIDLGVVRPTAAATAKTLTPPAKTGQHDNGDGVTNQSFLVSAKSYPLLHNLVTGTLRFTPGRLQQPQELQQMVLPEDEKQIFVDIDKVREEVARLQEHDEMLQNEIVNGEKKYRALLLRFQGLASQKKSSSSSADSGFGSGSENEHRLKQSQERNQSLQSRILELETLLNVAETHNEEQAKATADAAVERDAALARATATAERCKRLTADLDAARAKLAAVAHQRRLAGNAEREKHGGGGGKAEGGAYGDENQQQMQQMVDERERVIRALEDEREAATRSHRETCRLFKERIARLTAEKSMLAGDHAAAKTAASAAKASAATQSKKHAAALQQLRQQFRSQVHERVHEQVRQKVRVQVQQAQQQVRQQARQQVRQQVREQVRRQCSERERALLALGERQRAQIATLQGLLHDRETGVRQLDENVQQLLRASWTAQDETLVQMMDALQRMRGEDTEDDADDVDDEAEEEAGPDYDEDGDGGDYNDLSLAESDMSAVGVNDGDDDAGETVSVDENMTSAFFLSDIEMRHDDEEGTDVDADAEANVDGIEAGSHAVNGGSRRVKTVAFEQLGGATSSAAGATAAAAATATVCRHNRVNCVVCVQNAASVQDHAKVTVAVPRPVPGRGNNSKAVHGSHSTCTSLADQARQAQSHVSLPEPSMDPGQALAYVMKLLEDERRHLWMQICERRREEEHDHEHGSAQHGSSGAHRKRVAKREPDTLWNAYVLKVEQLNRLDDVLAGQQEAGQEMTREEIDVTITRILGGE